MVDEFDVEAWFEAAARCSQHPKREAVNACARCGGFQCNDCLDASERTLCERCGALALRQHVRASVQALALKLLLAPGFALLSTLLLLARQSTPPPILGVWLLPVACTVALLRTHRALFGWLAALVSLSILGSQAFAAFAAEAWVPLLDSALLSVAPCLALASCVTLSRAEGRLRLALT